jgi:hypothetical protein
VSSTSTFSSSSSSLIPKFSDANEKAEEAEDGGPPSNIVIAVDRPPPPPPLPGAMLSRKFVPLKESTKTSGSAETLQWQKKERVGERRRKQGVCKYYSQRDYYKKFEHTKKTHTMK